MTAQQTAWGEFIEDRWGNDQPTHTARVTVTVDVPLIVPPWVSPDDARQCAALLVRSAVEGAPLADAVEREWTFDAPELLLADGGGVTDVSGSIEAIE